MFWRKKLWTSGELSKEMPGFLWQQLPAPGMSPSIRSLPQFLRPSLTSLHASTFQKWCPLWERCSGLRAVTSFDKCQCWQLDGVLQTLAACCSPGGAGQSSKELRGKSFTEGSDTWEDIHLLELWAHGGGRQLATNAWQSSSCPFPSCVPLSKLACVSETHHPRQ